MVPWPISDRAIRTTTVSSGLTTTHTPSSGVASLGARLFGAERQIEADGQSATGGGAADHEGAAIHFWHDVHCCLPDHAFAAAWIAARTCWKVPQRQMLVIVLSMSASVGFGLFLSSSATAMIMPLWQ